MNILTDFESSRDKYLSDKTIELFVNREHFFFPSVWFHSLVAEQEGSRYKIRPC